MAEIERKRQVLVWEEDGKERSGILLEAHITYVDGPKEEAITVFTVETGTQRVKVSERDVLRRESF